MLLREALRVHDDGPDERTRQVYDVQQHRTHQRAAAQSAGAGQQDGQTVLSIAHHRLQLSSLDQQPAY